MDIVRNNPALENTPVASSKASYALGELLEIGAALVLAVTVLNWSLAGLATAAVAAAAAVYLRGRGAQLAEDDEYTAWEERRREERGFFVVNDRRIAVMKSLGADAAVLTALDTIKSEEALSAYELRIKLEDELGPAHTDEKLPMVLRYTRLVEHNDAG